MTKAKLHLDADCSNKQLWKALIDLGHDVTRTPQPDLPLDATDDEQLHWATGRGRILFTYNIADFIILTETSPNHAGILLASQSTYTITSQVRMLDRALCETEAEDWLGLVRWLSDWR